MISQSQSWRCRFSISVSAVSHYKCVSLLTAPSAIVTYCISVYSSCLSLSLPVQHILISSKCTQDFPKSIPHYSVSVLYLHLPSSHFTLQSHYNALIMCNLVSLSISMVILYPFSTSSSSPVLHSFSSAPLTSPIYFALHLFTFICRLHSLLCAHLPHPVTSARRHSILVALFHALHHSHSFTFPHPCARASPFPCCYSSSYLLPIYAWHAFSVSSFNCAFQLLHLCIFFSCSRRFPSVWLYWFAIQQHHLHTSASLEHMATN